MRGEEEGKKRVVVESLGWLTESSIMPKKHRAIEGVGASSIMELKAQLYQSQEESRKSKESMGSSDVQYHRAKQRIAANDLYSAKNSGVEARAHKDKLELKAVKDGSVSYAALEKKAELYEKLVKGEVSDEEEKEKYCVDFFRKGTEQEPTDSHDRSESAPPEYKDKNDMDDSSPFSTGFVGPRRVSGTVDLNDHKRFVREVHEEVNEAREKASEIKHRRQEQAAARREKLKQAYLRKQLEKLKASAGLQNSNVQQGDGQNTKT